MDLLNKNFMLDLDLGKKGSVNIKVTKDDDDQLNVFLKADHLATPFFDLSSDITSEIRFPDNRGADNKKKVVGKVWSQYSLINYKPVNDLSGQFEIIDKKLKVLSFSFGNLMLSGYLDLFYPYHLNFMVRLASIDMDDFLNFWISNKGYDSLGEVHGIIKVSGSLARPFLEGNLESQDGFIKTLNYNAINLKVHGFYPNMEIYDSSISQDDGTSFMFSGPFDLSDRKNFKKQIISLTLAPVVSKKDEEMNWTIKRLKDKGDNSTVELKYLLKQDTSEGISGQGISGVLGVEKIFKF